MTQRMHVVTVEFTDPLDLGKQTQSAYDDGFIMPDGSWRLISSDPPTVEFGIILDDLTIEQELNYLLEGLTEFVLTAAFAVVSVGAEEDHRYLYPCFS